MPRSNPGQARAARRDAGLCLRCGRPARATLSYVPAVVRRLADGGGTAFDYTRFLGRLWDYGDPIPTYARLAHDAWCSDCFNFNYEARELARQRRSRAERRAWERQRRRAENNERRYRQLAEAGRCPRCGGARDRQGVTCAACRSAGRHPPSARRERYRQLAEAGRCPRCGGARDRQGVTCSSCCRAARRRYLAARGGAAAVAGLEDDRNAGREHA